MGTHPMTRSERPGTAPLLLRAAAVWLAAMVAARAAGAGEAVGFYSESTSRLVSRRLDEPVTRKHKTWLTEDRLRFDHGDLLTIIVRLDTGEILVVNRPKRAYVRQSIKNLGGALVELGDAMVRHVPSRVVRTRNTREIGGRPCAECRIELARVPCSVWVEEDSREAFNAVRALAREASRKMGDVRAPLVLALGGLGGVPREFAIGDPKRLAFTWTVERHEQVPIPNRVFDLPAGCSEDASLPAAAYTLPEHVYFVGEVTAAWFAPTPEQRHRSLMPRGLEITNQTVLTEFYKGRQGAERYGILRWGKPLTFYLAPDLWRYPMSSRTIDLLLVIGTAFRGGGLRYYPNLGQIKRPAN